MTEFDYQELDALIHSRARLAIMALLASVREIDFNFFRERLNLTDGNLASHLRKLEDAGYIKMRKTFSKRRPRTTYTISKSGKIAFIRYVNAIEKIIKK
jgi:DNA-binding transcriptional ArsR family regulator